MDAILQEKEKEIHELKIELEKYKMSEKLATSIIDSPYTYNNTANTIRRRKRNPLNNTSNSVLDNAQNI